MWLDLTRDGPEAPDGRSAWTLSESGTDRELIDELAATEKSRRHEMRQALQHHSETMASSAVRRLGRRHDQEGAGSSTWSGTDPAVLRDALSIADWWWRQ
jgi:hypothetical protein